MTWSASIHHWQHFLPGWGFCSAAGGLGSLILYTGICLTKIPLEKRIILLAAEKLTRPVTNVIAVMNRQDEQIAQKHHLYKEQLVFIDGMGVDVSRFEKKRRNDQGSTGFAAGIFPLPQEFVMVCAAEFSDRKNQMFLIRAIRRLKQEDSLQVDSGRRGRAI